MYLGKWSRASAIALKVQCIIAFPLLFAQIGWTESQEPKHSLSSLYEEVFQGSRDVHMPKKLFTISAETQKVTSISVNDHDPFRYGRSEGYFFPRLTNDDESFLYFDPYYGRGPLRLDKNSNIEVPREAFRYDKKKKEIKIDDVQDMGEYLRDKVFGYYKHIENQSDGILRIKVEDNWAYIAQGGKIRAHDIINPKDLDSGADKIFLSRFQHTESDFPYMQAGRNMELLIYSRAERSILESLTLPFTGTYLPIKCEGIALQAVAGQNFVYFVLNSSMMDIATLTVPKSPKRWHVVIYDVKEDALYSVWHGMDESDGLKDLDFSYYLGLDGLYFEVLKKGKIEIYLLDIDLSEAKPLKEYETVDLLWNNKRLKEQWEKKIQEAKSKDPLFEERWE